MALGNVYIQKSLPYRKRHGQHEAGRPGTQSRGDLRKHRGEEGELVGGRATLAGQSCWVGASAVSGPASLLECRLTECVIVLC